VHSHNHLLDWYPGADGIKTGFINASGFNLAASAVRNGRRLIGVIMGGHTWRSRDEQMAALLDQGFADLAGAGAPQSPTAPVVAAAPAAPSPAPATASVRSTAPAPAVPPSPVATQTAAAQGSADPAGDSERSRSIGGMAKAALRHLAPVGKAEASTLSQERPGGGEEWSIQLGAFRAKAAAEQAARKVAHLAAVRGKPAQILPPGKSDRLYRARLLHFTGKGAQAACAELHKQRIACSVVRPSGLKVASE
jgi:D-alanyl-D-alanine carboxypeptidase